MRGGCQAAVRTVEIIPRLPAPETRASLAAFVAFYMLEPESDDGLVAWNFFGSDLAVGQEYPLLRVMDTMP